MFHHHQDTPQSTGYKPDLVGPLWISLVKPVMENLRGINIKELHLDLKVDSLDTCLAMFCNLFFGRPIVAQILQFEIQSANFVPKRHLELVEESSIDTILFSNK